MASGKGMQLSTNSSHRSTLGEIGNKPAQNISNKVTLKKDPIQSNQPQRVLKKNKATASLKAIAEDKIALKVNLM